MSALFWLNNPGTSYCFVHCSWKAVVQTLVYSSEKPYSRLTETINLGVYCMFPFHQICFSIIFHLYFHTVWILGRVLALICFPCCWASFVMLISDWFQTTTALSQSDSEFQFSHRMKHWSSCWFIFPMGRLYKLRVWLQQAPSWVCSKNYKVHL